MDDQDADDVAEARKLYDRGVFYLSCGLAAEAREYFERSSRLTPDKPAVWSALGAARRQAGDPAGAVKALEVALSLDPDFAAARDNLDRARADLRKAAPADLAALKQAYGKASQADDWPAAEAAARAIIGEAPGDARGWASLAIALRHLFRFEEALQAHDAAIAIDAGEVRYAAARAKTLWEAGAYEAAAADYAAVVPRLSGRDREQADARMALGMVRMTLGDMAGGLPDYEARWQIGKISLPDVAQPYWDGSLMPGGRLLFYGEQGFGDAIQFARYVPIAARRCGRVIVPCKPQLKRLMKTLPGNPDIRDQTVGRNDFDAYVPAMSMMRVLGITLDHVPADVPYLAADPADVARLRPLVEAAGPGLRIGIAWTGSPTNTIAWKKTVLPALWAPVLAAGGEGARFFSLQVMRDDMPAVVTQVPPGVTDLAPHLNDFADTAAAMACLDLVISVDTAVAHLAGALAVPAWTLVPHVPDWRWWLVREDSPWYPTMRLFRQPAHGDWATVMDRVAAALAAYPRPSAGRKGLSRLLPWGRK